MGALIDDWLPNFDVTEYHSIRVMASPEEAFDAIRNAPIASSRFANLLFRLRGIRGWGPTLTDLEQVGFIPLAERRPAELVHGLVGRFWTPRGGLIRGLGPEGFASFDRPGYAKAVWGFRVEPGDDACVVSTETRVATTDEAARRSFLRYWRVIGRFSGMTRTSMLRKIKKYSEQGHR